MVYFARFDIGEFQGSPDCTRRMISLIKIGTSVSVQERIVNHRAASGKPVTLLATLPGGAEEEAALHRRFAHIRVPGRWRGHDPEWFYPTRELMDFIEDLKKSRENSESCLDVAMAMPYHQGVGWTNTPTQRSKAMTTAKSKTLAEMTMGELVQADIENSNALEAWCGASRAGELLTRRREIRAEMDRRYGRYGPPIRPRHTGYDY